MRVSLNAELRFLPRSLPNSTFRPPVSGRRPAAGRAVPSPALPFGRRGGLPNVRDREAFAHWRIVFGAGRLMSEPDSLWIVKRSSPLSRAGSLFDARFGTQRRRFNLLRGQKCSLRRSCMTCWSQTPIKPQRPFARIVPCPVAFLARQNSVPLPFSAALRLRCVLLLSLRKVTIIATSTKGAKQ